MASVAAGTSKGAKADTQEKVTVSPPSRREFLYYIWGASVVLVLGQVGAGVLWFAYPRFAEGTFGGVFGFSPENVPLPGGTPVSVPSGRFHVANLETEELVVLYGVCTHLGCLPPWVPANSRFECPCHGSKFERSGKYIEGPAPRSLDRFSTTITFEDGTVITTNAEGDPIPLQGRRIASIAINTGDRIRRTGALAKA
jgi:cytochrome b6-f complex iron-sulfur subunit